LRRTPRTLTAARRIPPGFGGSFDASLTDGNSGTLLQTIPVTSWTWPVWFNATGKRYGLGGVRTNSRMINFDDFTGTAQ